MSVNPDVQRIQNAMLSTDLNVRALSQSLNQVTSQISTINDLMIKQRDLATDEFQQIQQWSTSIANAAEEVSKYWGKTVD